MQAQFLKYSVLTICMASILTACGGGGGSTPAPGAGGGTGGGGGNPPVTLTGRAIDGPLAGATVTFATCTDEVITDGEGNFDIPANCGGQITISGGIDTITSVPFSGQLKGTTSSTGESIVSPLTTLVENLGGDTAAIASLATALGLTVEQLTSDPMDNKEVYEKAVTVQMLLDEVSKNIDALGSDLTPAQISATAASALSTALKETNGAATLSSPTLITTVLTQTLSTPAIVTSLSAAGVTSTNVADVATNLAALTTANISDKIADAKTAIDSVPASGFTPAALTTASAGMSEYKNDPVVSNLVAGLATTIITTSPADAQSTLQQFSTVIADSTATADQVNTVVETVASAPNSIIPPEIVQGIKDKVASFHANYYELLGFNVGGANDITPYALTGSLTTPLSATTSILNNLKFNVKAHGTYVGGTQNFKVALGVTTTEGDYINISASKIALTFNANGGLTAASIPTDSVVVATSSNQNLVATSNSRSTAISALNSGKVNLSTATLNTIFVNSNIGTRINNFNLNNRTVTVTGVLSPIGTNTNAIIAADKQAPADTAAKYAVSSVYNVGSSAGAGFRAKFIIGQ